MKKIQLKRRKKEVAEEAPSRITNETVAEHREQVLAGGRRFKYPRQYARHKLVINAILISLVTLVVVVAIAWWRLYPAQTTSTFFYRLTRIVPVPVASVDGTNVRYSDYLMRLTPSIRYLEDTERINLDTEDGKRQIEFYKRKALDSAIADTYAEALAKQKKIVVDDTKVQATIEQMLNTASGRITEEVYNASTYEIYGYSPEEYREILHQSLIRQEVAYAIDTKAIATKKLAQSLMLKKKYALSELAKQLQKKGHTVQVGTSGLVPKSNHHGGLSAAALKLQTGKTSGFIRSTTGDGYYLVQLVSQSDTQLNYNYLRIPLTEFDAQLKSVIKNDKVHEYIKVEKAASEVIRR
ncbi:MAG TPA: SurA N-terminal domain-containing protein [Candidatus Saccharibacteria bacterium]|nr:SurA N-terminal domain-containing protein [Candidatus Saccharibacteria bacterium]